ncbi:DUF3786 domain-containing protein [Desulfoluna spongiiphila]|uniref:DUF3786 domain-containing protein n=1 Tax=Desulfoluna spongiiphila TaxID=419481 RepID=UPI001253945B|nr:DUF3786 domain-containing protein [Desulfoluna spongiiphila]VVS95621.1 consensus disorder prediction [Desulfoluna spongiiphila]
MSQFSNAMEIFKLLPRTNCRDCNESTCLAFASKVFLGQKPLDRCPHAKPAPDGGGEKEKGGGKNLDEQREEHFKALKSRLASLDLNAAAERVGGVYENGKLTLRIFGKPLSVDNAGNLFSDIHLNPMISAMVFKYILSCEGAELTGDWLPLRELKDGREKNGLFVQRSELPFKALADTYPDLFEELIVLFNGEAIDERFQSDISLVLRPLPRLPILVCYWKPDEGMDSDLHLFFDASADKNGGIDTIYTVASGIVMMFEKIARRHWSI